jgi:cytochrome c oxidase cbb3-type subunit I/II
MVRTHATEALRYGSRSYAGEYVYDRPFQWGSKRTGPDLMRVGGKYPDLWHYNHMMDPRSTSPGSIMPAYPWLADGKVDLDVVPTKIRAMKHLGVPYAEADVASAREDYLKQANQIAGNLARDGIKVEEDSEILAMIAYMQRMGTDLKKADPKELLEN